MILKGTQSNIPWTARLVGEDIVVDNVITTWFGGDHDPEDNGETASGINTKHNPNIMGCAIPKNIGLHFKATAGSPIPNFPYKTEVEVTRVNIDGTPLAGPITVIDIDLGPNILEYPSHGLDLTIAAFKELGGDLKAGLIRTSFRIKGVAKYVHIPSDAAESSTLV